MGFIQECKFLQAATFLKKFQTPTKSHPRSIQCIGLLRGLLFKEQNTACREPRGNTNTFITTTPQFS